jgi:PAS domain S-box-containing protein
VTHLEEIKDTVQEVAEAIAAVLGIETEITDETLTIIAGTGRYLYKIGLKEEGGDLKSGDLYGEAIRTGEAYVIEVGKNHPNYAPKEGELAEVCCPILLEDQVIGLMGLVAFREDQRQRLLENRESLLLFLKRMAFLVASKVAETKISNRMKAVLNSIHDGILSVDGNGIITSCNPTARRMLGREDRKLEGTSIFLIWPNSPVLDSIRTGKKYKDHEEITRVSMSQINHFVTTISPIFAGEGDTAKVTGAVISFRDMEDVRQMVYNLTEIEETSSFHQILGTSRIARQLREQGERIAGSNSTVLISGESGTGKGLLARAIHSSSPIKNGPFITVNCGAIPDMLLESELFGYEEGAFTGARKSGKIGRFEMANGGTIFLDEIGDLPLHLQVKILHVLQQKEIQRVGGTEYIPVQIRVIAATNRDLEQMIHDRQFREDLYFRLNVIPIQIPALRERPEDIQQLLDHALAKYNRLTGKSIGGFEPSVRNMLIHYRWPGNIRELENVVEYGVTMETGSLILQENLPPHMRKETQIATEKTLREQCDEAEKRIITECLRATGHSLEGKIKAAAQLGISESTLYRRIRALNIRPDEE